MCHGSLYDPYGHRIGFVDNFYTKLGSAQMNLELEDGRTFQFNPGDLLRDRQGDWHIRKLEESMLDSMRYIHWADCVMEEATKKKEQADKLSDIRGEVTEIGWGNQIRSYVMQPYTMVKDHRTNAETGNVDAVMDGGIDLFINAYLKWIALGTGAKEEEA